MSLNRITDKHIIVYAYNEMIFSNRTGIINSCKNMDGPLKNHFAKKTKSDPNGYMAAFM